MAEDRVELARVLQELGSNALGATVVQAVGGWRLRFAHGYTRRANSVLPDSHDGRVGLEEKLAEAEAFYTRRGLPSRFQLSPASEPRELDGVLEARGYRYEMPTEVQVAPLGEVLARLDLAAAEPRWATVEVTPEPDDAWLETSYRTSGRGGDHSVARQILEDVGPPGAFVLLREGDQPVAVGRAVVERGWAGVFAMATVPAARRRGAARAVLAALARWADSAGASRLYLQVETHNQGAMALYRHAGFRPVYTYHYRSADPSRGGGSRS